MSFDLSGMTNKVAASVLATIFVFSAYIYAEDKAETEKKLESKADLELIQQMLNQHKELLVEQKATNAQFQQAIMLLSAQQARTQALIEQQLNIQAKALAIKPEEK